MKISAPTNSIDLETTWQAFLADYAERTGRSMDEVLKGLATAERKLDHRRLQLQARPQDLES